MCDNGKIVHNVKGLLSPINTLVQLLELKYDNSLGIELNEKRSEEIEKLIKKQLSVTTGVVCEIAKLLDEVR